MFKLNAFLHSKSIRYFIYFSLIAAMISLLWGVGQFFHVNQFMESVELKTLDFRYNMPNKTIKHNPNVVILSIDDTSLEELQAEFGTWPWKRDAYTKVIEYMELGGVNSVIFDLMFTAYQKGFEKEDQGLIEILSKYDNVYLAMNFDDRKNDSPPVLPEGLKVKVENNSYSVNFENFTFANCRLIMDDILKSTSNIGMTNFLRDKDGISRHAPLFVAYQGDFYPYLGFKAAYEYLKKKENLNTEKFVINKNSELILGNRKIPLNNDGQMLLNWYGTERTFEHIPFYEVIKSINNTKKGKQPLISADYFKNKVVFVGVTANSMFDIKTTPLSRIYPGVEIQATTFNNLVDDNTIKKANESINFLICIILSVITGILVIKLRSVITSSLMVILLAILYIAIASILFNRYFIWVGISNEIIVITLTFVFMYIIKYLMKSRDFEYTYKLATTDGLTSLYNHRYFQENLNNAINKAQKTNSNFSLVFVDIDFFKKFNDTYGHQAGDIVLKYVAQTLKYSVKSSDFVARYGGEEMVAILYNTNAEKALKVANRLCKTIAGKKFKLSEGLEVGVTISLGVATYPIHGKVPIELVEFADQGLYRAKENGRNQVGSLEKKPEINPDEVNPEPA